MDTYEKKYKEALERAKKWCNAPNVDKIPTFANRVIEEIFPELKESEDNRVRKWLIDTLKGYHHLFEEGGVTKEDMLAWLEKQATPQMVEDAFLKGCNDTKKSLLKKQGKQKSVGEEIVEALRAEYKKGRAEVFAEMQKKWSDEDEERIKNILSVLDVQVCWNGATGKKENPYQKEIDWLKSLKERYTWKPSDEQMEFLQKCIEAYNEVTFPTEVRVLSSLYNDLKKLKE
jgi:hypothetical protein